MSTITKPKLSARSKKLYVSFSINGEQVRRSLNIEDTKAMAEKITQLLTDEQQSQRLANALYHKAKDDFTWDKALKKYCSFIQS